MEMLDTLRNFINHMKRYLNSRPSLKTNKISPRLTKEVNESDINTVSLEQVQKLVNKVTDLVYDALMAADYTDEVETRRTPASPQLDSQ